MNSKTTVSNENLDTPSIDYIQGILMDAGGQLHRANGSGIFKPQGKQALQLETIAELIVIAEHAIEWKKKLEAIEAALTK